MYFTILIHHSWSTCFTILSQSIPYFLFPRSTAAAYTSPRYAKIISTSRTIGHRPSQDPRKTACLRGSFRKSYDPCREVSKGKNLHQSQALHVFLLKLTRTALQDIYPAGSQTLFIRLFGQATRFAAVLESTPTFQFEGFTGLSWSWYSHSRPSVTPMASKTYIVEHLDDELGPWSELEYLTIAKESHEVGAKFCLSSVPPSLELPATLKVVPGFTADGQSVEVLYAQDKSRVCLLDPSATKELSPEDSLTFDAFLFGGILGEFWFIRWDGLLGTNFK